MDEKRKQYEIKRAERQMALIPDCDNCKHYSQSERRGETYCSKLHKSYPVLCKYWYPQIVVIHDTADARIRYIALTKEEKKEINDKGFVK